MERWKNWPHEPISAEHRNLSEAWSRRAEPAEEDPFNDGTGGQSGPHPSEAMELADRLERREVFEVEGMRVAEIHGSHGAWTVLMFDGPEDDEQVASKVATHAKAEALAIDHASAF